jgi:hypothetical protein
MVAKHDAAVVRDQRDRCHECPHILGHHHLPLGGGQAQNLVIRLAPQRRAVMGQRDRHNPEPCQ